MTRPLVALAAHLAPMLAGLDPAAPGRLPWREALDLVAAEDVDAPSDLPPASVALRSGFAVNALDCAGASPQTPAPLPAMPVQVAAGDPLPPGCDAILDPAALHRGRFGPEAMEPVEPGAGVRRAGEDLTGSKRILSAGQRIRAEQILAAGVAGIADVAVRRPTVRLDWKSSPERDWLALRLAGCGARIADADSRADLLFRPAADDKPAIALAPGGAAWAERSAQTVSLSLPPRFDALIGAWCALALPILARLAGTGLVSTPAILSGKIASTVGWSEVALLRLEGNEAHPLAVGDAPLDRLLRTDAFALLAPESEGAPAGAPINVISLDRPF
jgi:molybdopterin biosynthesis enzyme